MCQDASGSFGAVPAGVREGPDEGSMDQQDMTREKVGHVAFTFVHMNPHHLKRPLSSADAMNTNHLALRLHKVLSVSAEGEVLNLEWKHHVDVVSELFSCEDVKPSCMMENLRVWDVDKDFLWIDERDAGSLSLHYHSSFFVAGSWVNTGLVIWSICLPTVISTDGSEGPCSQPGLKFVSLAQASMLA